MYELGNVQLAAQGTRALKLPRKEPTGPTQETVTIRIAADDAAAAVIRNPLHAQTADAQEGDLNADGLFSQHQSMKSTLTGVREKLAKLGELTEENASGSFSAKTLALDMEAQTEDISSDIENSGYSIYSNVSNSLAALREEIEAINSYDGFLLGVQEKIEKFTTQAEFELKQILDVEQSIAEQNSTLEIAKFTLRRIHMEQVKALRNPMKLDPERVLYLLKDDVASPSTTQQDVTRIAAPPEQHVSTQNSGQG